MPGTARHQARGFTGTQRRGHLAPGLPGLHNGWNPHAVMNSSVRGSVRAEERTVFPSRKKRHVPLARLPWGCCLYVCLVRAPLSWLRRKLPLDQHCACLMETPSNTCKAAPQAVKPSTWHQGSETGWRRGGPQPQVGITLLATATGEVPGSLKDLAEQSSPGRRDFPPPDPEMRERNFHFLKGWVVCVGGIISQSLSVLTYLVEKGRGKIHFYLPSSLLFALFLVDYHFQKTTGLGAFPWEWGAGVRKDRELAGQPWVSGQNLGAIPPGC